MRKQQQGFAVLTTVVILSIAGIAYTTHMAYLQLIDNKVLANYYRNNEAFANAESGINLILSKLNTVTVATDMLDNLPFTYPAQVTPTTLYQVSVTALTTNKLHVSSIGYSVDGSALRNISVDVYYYIDFETPIAPLLSNGNLKINGFDSINDGCDGLSISECRSPGNMAKKVIISQPISNEPMTNQANINIDNQIESDITEISTLCSDGLTVTGSSIDLDAINGQLIDQEGATRFQEVSSNQWGAAASITSPIFDGITSIEDVTSASSLFESTFGVTWENAKAQFIHSESVEYIDMTDINTVSCSEELQYIDEDINIIYIQGDCIVDPLDTSFSNTSGTALNSHHFTIGSTDNPKMVFIEGGTFIAPANTTSSVVGMLYLIPAKHEVLDTNGNAVYIDGIKQTLVEQDVDIAGIQVSGSILSEYNCTASVAGDHNNASKHFSTRYDKNVLNLLYKRLGMIPSESHYQLVAGTWRDF